MFPIKKIKNMTNWYNLPGDLNLVPNTEGVYLLADDHHNTVYVGRTDDLNKRLFEHPDPQNPCLRKKNIQYFAFEENPNSEARETELINEHDPECNRA